MKNNFKYDRLAEELQELLSSVINEDIDGCDYVSITDVELTKDLQDAKVYFTSLEDKDKTLEILNQNIHMLKNEIASRMEIRKIPNLIFKYDESLDNYNKIEALLEK